MNVTDEYLIHSLSFLLIFLFPPQCNNPKTKEPKLQAAVRIVAEWTDYDQEIKRLLTKVQEGVAEKRSAQQPDSGMKLMMCRMDTHTHKSGLSALNVPT